MPLNHILEFSRDALSDTTPTWVDISAYLLEVSDCTIGVSGDLDEPQPGTATFRLSNTDRRFEPDFAAGAYYPDIRPLRRIRWRINDGVTTHDMFLGYVVDWGLVWPDQLMNQEAVVRCVDGFELLSLDRLGPLDPPDASSLADVILFDAPFAAYALNEKSGTKMTALTGPDGTYKSRPLLGQSGLIVGEDSTAVIFEEGDYGHIPLTQDNHFSDNNAATLEVKVRPITTSGPISLLRGAEDATGGTSMVLSLEAGPIWRAHFEMTDGTDVQVQATTVPSTSRTDHLKATWDGQTARMYVNGVEEASTTVSGKSLLVAVAPSFMAVASNVGAVGRQIKLQYAAFYEHALSAERVLAHYQAGAERGYAAELAGERITDAATSDLWAETSILTGAHEVVPKMHTGQSRLDAIREAARTEQPASLFFFKGNGDPVYLGWEYRATGTYNTTQATIGDATGEVPYEDMTVVYDDEMFNMVTGSREDGLEQTVTDEDSRTEFRDRGYDITGLAVTNDEDVLEVANAILADHAEPQIRVASVSLTDQDATASAQILARMPGDLIRVRRRPKGGTAIDRVTHIRGRRLSVGEDEVLRCEWALARGFNAALGQWQLGISGFTELGSTAVLA